MSFLYFLRVHFAGTNYSLIRNKPICQSMSHNILIKANLVQPTWTWSLQPHDLNQPLFNLYWFYYNKLGFFVQSWLFSVCLCSINLCPNSGWQMIKRPYDCTSCIHTWERYTDIKRDSTTLFLVDRNVQAGKHGCDRRLIVKQFKTFLFNFQMFYVETTRLMLVRNSESNLKGHMKTSTERTPGPFPLLFWSFWPRLPERTPLKLFRHQELEISVKITSRVCFNVFLCVSSDLGHERRREHLKVERNEPEDRTPPPGSCLLLLNRPRHSQRRSGVKDFVDDTEPGRDFDFIKTKNVTTLMLKSFKIPVRLYLDSKPENVVRNSEAGPSSFKNDKRQKNDVFFFLLLLLNHLLKGNVWGFFLWFFLFVFFFFV